MLVNSNRMARALLIISNPLFLTLLDTIPLNYRAKICQGIPSVVAVIISTNTAWGLQAPVSRPPPLTALGLAALYFECHPNISGTQGFNKTFYIKIRCTLFQWNYKSQPMPQSHFALSRGRSLEINHTEFFLWVK